MCSNYFPTTEKKRLEHLLGHALVADWQSPRGKLHVWNHYPAPFIRKHPHADVGDEAVPPRELLTGEFGLVPHWSKDRVIKYSTFNARSETVATTASYRGAWSAGQRCIIPADWVVEPDWRSGKHVPTRIGRADEVPMPIAGVWDRWVDKGTGEVVFSFSMLTVNADGHELMKNFHKPQDEKRMVVILQDDACAAWLNASPREAASFLKPYKGEMAISAMTA